MKKLLALCVLTIGLVACTPNTTDTTQQVATPTPTPTASPTPSPASSSGEVNGSFMSLLGRNQMCTYTGNTSGVAIAGTVYVSGQKFRSEAKTTLQGQSFTGYSIGDGEKMTFWSDLMPTQKMTYTYEELKNLEKDATGSAKKNTDAYKDFMKSYTYTCEAWIPDESKFVIPR